jgi:hypothetical protein
VAQTTENNWVEAFGILRIAQVLRVWIRLRDDFHLLERYGIAFVLA